MHEINFSFVDKNLSPEHREILKPKRGSSLASGFDLASSEQEALIIAPGSRVLIPTGISLGLSAGLEGQVRGRSGLALKHGLMVLNSPGTIDADYRGEIKVILANMSQEAFTVIFGMRIAQLVIAPVCLAEAKIVESLAESARGALGFGSTGLMSVSVS
jgi:dUTP pyrophosphatase